MRRCCFPVRVACDAEDTNQKRVYAWTAAEMSGGEQQRTVVAGALAVQAIMFADQPIGHLDAENSRNIVMLLSKGAGLYEQTIIMVTHDKQKADYTDRIIMIKDGTIHI